MSITDLTEEISWMKKAVKIIKKFSRSQPGRHYVYIVLLARVKDKYPGYALYVGESSLKPEKRFKQHISGYKSSRWVREYGVQLLPELYSHLIPLKRKEAKSFESEIAEALKKENIPVLM